MGISGDESHLRTGDPKRSVATLLLQQRSIVLSHLTLKEAIMPKRSGVESGAGGNSSHRGGAGHAGAGAQSGAGDSKKHPTGRKKSTSGPKK